MYTGQTAAGAQEAGIELPEMTDAQHVLQDYSIIALSLKAHPVSFLREKLTAQSILSTQKLNDYKEGTIVKVAGLVLVRQRPGTASGICFITLEDETDTANLLVYESVFETYRKHILRSTLLLAEGKLQREGEVTHVIVQRCKDISSILHDLVADGGEKLSVTSSRVDEKDGQAISPQDRKKKLSKAVQLEMFPQGRNFK